MYYDHRNVKNARKLRKDMTPWERKLWYCYLNKYPIRFHRQVPVDKFIVDFYCPKASLVIELDGGGHYETEAMKKDLERTEILEKLNLKVIRFSNKDVDKNFYGVCMEIDREVNNRYKGKNSPSQKSKIFDCPLREGAKATLPPES